MGSESTVGPSRLELGRGLCCMATLALLAGCGPADGGLTGEESDEEQLGEVREELAVASPVPGRGITTPFGKPGSWAAGYHTGDDYAAPTGTPVVATRGGRVVAAGWNIWGVSYGLQVIVETAGVRHLYAHLSALSVGAGANVAQGQRLGLVGSTGNATGPHCHYEERVAPYGYYNHRKPQFNRSALPPGGGGGGSGGGGFKSWVFETRHPDIEGLQRALVSAGCDVPGKYTDYYGANTRAAVTCFQQKQGWSGSGADGLVGPTTVARLYLVGDVYVSKLSYGQQDSDSVRMLQQRLNEVRKVSLPISGNYLDQTRDEARAWQLSIGDMGVAADGNIGPRQAAALFGSGRYTVH